MTADEWNHCENAVELLRALPALPIDRKQRLYLCGGCRTICSRFYDDASRRAIEVAERFADGLATDDELSTAKYYAEGATFKFDFDPDRWRLHTPPGEIPDGVKKLVQMGLLSPHDYREIDSHESVLRQAEAFIAYVATFEKNPFNSGILFRYLPFVNWPGAWLVRDIFGNPFRTLTFAPRWLSSTVLDLSRTIYDDRLWERMPILGDALMDAGCDNEEVVAHCQGPGPHARGCWLVDAILAKA